MYVDPDGTKIIDIKKVYKAGKKIWKKIKKGVGVGVTYVKNVVTDVKDYFVYKFESGINYIREKTWKGKFLSLNINVPDKWYKFWEYSVGLSIHLEDFNISLQSGVSKSMFSLGFKNKSYYIFAEPFRRGVGVSNIQGNFESYFEYSVSTLFIAGVFATIFAPSAMPIITQIFNFF